MFEEAAGPDGKVRDPLTGEEIKATDPWDLGHKPGYEHAKHQQSAANRGLTRPEFLQEMWTEDHYRPETPATNRSHAGESSTWDEYYGP